MNCEEMENLSPQQAHFFKSPQGLTQSQDGLEPFRPINMDQIQNSSNGKQNLSFRSPLTLRK